MGRVNTCTHSKELSYKVLLLPLMTRTDKRMYLQVHLFGVMFHSGPVRLSEEGGGPPKIKIIIIGINPPGVCEILAKEACQSIVGALFFQQYGTNPIINHTGVRQPLNSVQFSQTVIMSRHFASKL